MNHENQTPYARLNPNVIFDAIESTGFSCTGSLLALNSYENRVYQIGIEDAEPLPSLFPFSCYLWATFFGGTGFEAGNGRRAWFICW